MFVAVLKEEENIWVRKYVPLAPTPKEKVFPTPEKVW